MVDKEVAQAVDQQIKEARGALLDLPEPLRKRTIQLKMMHDEVISKIKQVDGVQIEFEER